MRIGSAPRSGISPRPDPDGPPSGESAELPAGESADLLASPSAAVTPVVGAAERPAYHPLSGRARLLALAACVVPALIFVLAVHTILRPFIWAAVIAYILNPLVGMLQRRLRMRRGFAVAAVMLVLVGLIAWGIVRIVPTLGADTTALTNSLALFDTYVTTVLPNSGTISVVGIPVQTTMLVHNLQGAINDLPHVILGNGMSVATSAVETLLRFLTFLISTVYLLLDGPRLGTWLTGRIPPGQRGEAITLARRIGVVLSEYLRAEVILILIMSTVSLVALTILGVRFALLLAPIVGFLEIFPIIGPFFAIGLVTIVALVSPPAFNLTHPGYALVVALVFFALRQLEDYLVIPNVVGHAVKLHPVLILFALLSGATLGGILGMFLAVPITGALKVLGSYTYDRLVA